MEPHRNMDHRVKPGGDEMGKVVSGAISPE
jgi:hypothetical protein